MIPILYVENSLRQCTAPNITRGFDPALQAVESDFGPLGEADDADSTVGSDSRWPTTHALLDIIFSTSGNVPKELEVLDGAIMERYERGRPTLGERPPTAFLVIEIYRSVSNEVAKRKAQENSKKHVWRTEYT